MLAWPKARLVCLVTRSVTVHCGCCFYLVRAVLRVVRRPRVPSRVFGRVVAERDAMEISALAPVRVPAIILDHVRHRFSHVRLREPPRRVDTRVLLHD